MRYGVVTEELVVVAAAVHADSSRVRAHVEPLRSAGDHGADWAAGRARTAAQALFDTLAQAAVETATALSRLGDQVAAAGDEYEVTDGHSLRPS